MVRSVRGNTDRNNDEKKRDDISLDRAERLG